MKVIKVIYIISAALSLSLIQPSCTKMDEEIYSQLRADDFFKREADVVAAMAPVYAGFRPLLSHQSWWDIEETTDIAVTPTRGSAWYDGGIYQRLHKHEWTASDAHFNSGGSIWNKLYNNVNNCNRVIYQIENADFEIQGKESYLAEVRTARAYIYYMLCSLFGNIPIVDKYDVPDGYLPETKPRKEVFDFIVKELTESIPNLNEQAGGAMYGRLNKWAGLTLLARTYLNAEAWIGTPMWDECLDACEQIIIANKYSLAANFRNNFLLTNHQSKEIIFAWPFDETFSGNNIYIAYQKTLHGNNLRQTYNAQTGAHDGVQAVPSFIDTFDPDDRRLAATFVMGQQYAMNGTPLKCTGIVPRDNGKPLAYTNTLSNIANAGEAEGYRFGKFEIKIGTKATPDNDWPAMRYAEVLYMKAECLLRKGTDGAAALVNQVRARAFNTPHPVTDSELSATIVVNNVPVQYGLMLQEWGWEFAEEALRREQLIRFDNNFIKGSWTAKAPSEEFRNLFPIPVTAIASNKNLVQNTGYE